jgi:hypothetical protein
MNNVNNNNLSEDKEKNLNDYRKGLIDVQVKLGESYDKLIITLSGGALALSITFLKDIVTLNNIVYPLLLISAWGLFVISLSCILGEILFGIKAYKKAIKQIDDGTIYDEKVGGKASSISNYLQLSAAITLIAGLLLISLFAFLNIGECHDKSKTNTKTTTTSKTATNTQALPHS